MNVMFATYPMAFHTPGGGEVQLLSYEQHLPAHGVTPRRLDPWNPRFLEHDVVHFFSCVGGSSHLCGFVKGLGLPLVVSSSLWMTEETAGNFPIDEIRHQLALADRVVTNSATESETLAKVLGLPGEKFVVVSNAIDEVFFAPADPALFREAFGIEGPFALCVGNIEPRKNQLALVAAMQQHPDLVLVLAGEVRDPRYWAQVQHAAGGRVVFIGAIPHHSVLLRSAYAACEVFVLPSLFETPGLAALEAAAQRARIAITSQGSTGEYFGDAVHYLMPDSVSSIAEAIAAARAGERCSYVPPIWGEATGKLAGIYAELVR